MNISYERAKELAIENTNRLGATINSAGEFPDAYVFWNKTRECKGVLPIVIKKNGGEAVNYWNYLVSEKLNEDDMKERAF